MITIASDLESNYAALEIAEKYPYVYASAGIHPHAASTVDDEAWEKLKAWCGHPKVVAIGETGLDYHYRHSPVETQQAVFRKHLELALETALPVIIHSREAKEDTMRILSGSGCAKGVFHCFSGDIEMAEKALTAGFHISFAGPVTFKNAAPLREVVSRIPDDYLLIETDSPYLAPVPLRGKRNEPGYIIYTAHTIAEIRGVSLEDIARITSVNARRLFGIGGQIPGGEITYKIRDSLYLNITNRCTNLCSFCMRLKKDFVKGHNLRLSHEPSEEELKAAIGDPGKYREIVFCGYGEPLLRLEIIKSVASWVKQRGGTVRINTNGHGNLIHERNILPELHGIVDAISISLDAHDERAYNTICKPVYKGAFTAVIDFAREAIRYIPRVTLTVVDVDGVNLEESGKIAKALGADFRIRKLNDVG
jgi:TatD DNase family protein